MELIHTIKLRNLADNISNSADYIVKSTEISKNIWRNLNLESKILYNGTYTENSLKIFCRLKYILGTRIPGYTTISRSGQMCQMCQMCQMTLDTLWAPAMLYFPPSYFTTFGLNLEKGFAPFHGPGMYLKYSWYILYKRIKVCYQAEHKLSCSQYDTPTTIFQQAKALSLATSFVNILFDHSLWKNSKMNVSSVN